MGSYERTFPHRLYGLANGIQRDALSGVIAFDVETFSPNGFPYDFRDPLVNFSLVAPLNGLGLLSLSVIGDVNLEDDMLSLLYEVLHSFCGFYLLTYNGAKFDLEYVARRGRLYGLDFSSVFSSMRHVDVYRFIRRVGVEMPRFDQKSVEIYFGFRRTMKHISGDLYHLSYRRFLESGSLEPAFYNIEDSYGCLRIADAVLSFLTEKKGSD
ncbi:ribonuclease H-like domain-containing protein [Candidatus Bathyarchaeota archaeon]|nr:ribonuclease H-like domain-containing protein [Candidatus Bathyarchaeota archaeon]